MFNSSLIGKRERERRGVQCAAASFSVKGLGLVFSYKLGENSDSFM